jgi:sugar phosphate isomerase/epimerase
VKIVCAWMYAIGKYGFPPAIADIYRAVAEMREMGFAYGELEGIGFENIDRVASEKARIRAAYREAGVAISSFAVLLPEVISMDPAVKARALASFRRGAETAAFLGSENLWIDSYFPPLELVEGVLPTDELVYGQSFRVRIPEGFSWEAFWDTFLDTVSRCAAIARECGLPLLLEPRVGETVSNTDAMLRLWDTLREENLGFILDVAHQHAQKESIPLAIEKLLDGQGYAFLLGIEKLGRHLRYVHVADNDGRANRHFAPGNGTVDWDEVFRVLARRGFDGFFAVDLEKLPDPERQFAESKAFLERYAEKYRM